MPRNKWTVYILKCADRTLYTGVTTDLERRIAMHQSGKGAKYTRGRGPFKLLFTKTHRTKSAALRHEAAIKKLKRKEKISLCKTGEKT